PLGYVVCLFSAASIDPLIDILKVARFHWTAAEPIIARRLGRQHKGQMEQAEVAFHARDRRGAMQRIGTGLREFIASKRRAQEKQDTVAEKKIA
ncbi:MAG: hypothetical protein KDJ16_10950, partial [Hyphomicrobiales bacterium]|nr:hypothetical protein [Hyphomicrobiales bacterium]